MQHTMRKIGLLAVVMCGVLLIRGAAEEAPGAPDRSRVPLRELFSVDTDTTVEYYENRLEQYYAEVVPEYPFAAVRSQPDMEVRVGSEAISATSELSGASLDIRADYQGRNDVLVWDHQVDWIEWTLSVPRNGYYEIVVEYLPVGDTSNASVRSLLVDGSVPFLEAYRIEFSRSFRDAAEPKVNNIGDEVRPRQMDVSEWRAFRLCDSQGMYAYPFVFALEEGEHTVRLAYVERDIAISNISLATPRYVPTYQEVAERYRSEGYQAAKDSVEFQAESTVTRKSDPILRRESDGDPETEPVSAGNRKLNIIGGWRWKEGAQSITWEFTAPEDGLYKIGARLLHVWNDGLPTFRTISIDGAIPFREMADYLFDYDRDWRVEVLANRDGEPYEFYLEEGTHTITMTVTLGPTGHVIRSVNDDALLMSRVLRRIIMITGSNPDPNYEYELDENIPDLLENLRYLSDQMAWKVDVLTGISSKRPAIANQFLRIKSQLDRMIGDPDGIHKRLNDLTNAQTSLGSWYLNLQRLPLAIDYFRVGPPDQKWGDDRSNLFQRVVTTWKNFLTSFSKDYDSVGSVYETEEPEESGKVLNVWVARGREWAEIIKEMADESFTPVTGIPLNMNVVPGGQLNAGAVNVLMLSITSGNAPDVACGVTPYSPVEFAIRDAVVDLTQFPDYDEVVSRFLPEVIEPFRYRGGVYGLPETMDFHVLMYRLDVLQELNIRLPDTWEDVYTHVLPILYQNGMQFYYGVPTMGGGAQADPLTAPTLFQPFLHQLGGEFYRDGGSLSALDSAEAYMAFREYTELYTSYGLPEVASFYNRMRTGEIPIGIGSYGIYMQLSVAAPELAGRWGIALMPGHQRDDGTIDRTTGRIAQQADVILKQSDRQEEAWEFLKWWTSVDVQEQFGKELEALIGSEARWNTANVEAFTRLPWKRDHIEVIQESWNWTREIPVVLGGYFTSRHIVNAWTRVVLGGDSVRDSLELAVKEINRELRMKQEEYGVLRSIAEE